MAFSLNGSNVGTDTVFTNSLKESNVNGEGNVFLFSSNDLNTTTWVPSVATPCVDLTSVKVVWAKRTDSLRDATFSNVFKSSEFSVVVNNTATG